MRSGGTFVPGGARGARWAAADTSCPQPSELCCNTRFITAITTQTTLSCLSLSVPVPPSGPAPDALPSPPWRRRRLPRGPRQALIGRAPRGRAQRAGAALWLAAGGAEERVPQETARGGRGLRAGLRAVGAGGGRGAAGTGTAQGHGGTGAGQGWGALGREGRWWPAPLRRGSEAGCLGRDSAGGFAPLAGAEQGKARGALRARRARGAAPVLPRRLGALSRHCWQPRAEPRPWNRCPNPGLGHTGAAWHLYLT